MSRGQRKITIKEVREILAEEAVGLTDDDIQEIIDWLNNFADMAIEAVERNQTTNELRTKSNSKLEWNIEN